MGREGRIAWVGGGSGKICLLAEYKTQSVFSCSAHLPLIVLQGDASLGSVMRRRCACDERHGDRYSWNLLHFDRRDGRSIATSNCQGQPYVGGRNPSWVPALVPAVFASSLPAGEDGADEPPSRGLAGELPIVIALMAFHSTPGHASDVFADGLWDRNRWLGPTTPPIGCTSPFPPLS